jgi:hypothetical protein
LKHNQKISIEKASKQFVEDLLTITDPFVKKKHKDFLKLERKSQGEPFLQRMEAYTKLRSAFKDLLAEEFIINKRRQLVPY